MKLFFGVKVWSIARHQGASCTLDNQSMSTRSNEDHTARDENKLLFWPEEKSDTVGINRIW